MQLFRTLAVTIIAGLGALPAAADTVDMSFVETGAGQRVRIHTTSGSFNAFSGQLVHELSHGTGVLSGLDGLRTTFCTDLMQSVSHGGTEYFTGDVSEAPTGQPMGAAKAAAINDLYLFAAGRQFRTDSSNATDDFAAAFQIAIWEVCMDFNGNRSSLDHRYGSLRVTRTNGYSLSSSIRQSLSQLFDAIGHQTGSANLVALMSDEAQDQIIIVPLPAALLLGTAGLGFVVYRRRRMLASA